MNKELPCYIISDLLPLYQDDILSEQTKKDIDRHLSQCKDCKKKMNDMKMQIDVQTSDVELKNNPLKKVRFYQKALTALGAISFYFGCMFPNCCIRAYGSRTGRDSQLSNSKSKKSLVCIGVMELCCGDYSMCSLFFAHTAYQKDDQKEYSKKNV